MSSLTLDQDANDGPPVANLRIHPVILGNGGRAYRPKDNISEQHLVVRKWQDFSLDGTVDEGIEVVKFEDGSTMATDDSKVGQYNSNLNQVPAPDSDLSDDSDGDSTSSCRTHAARGRHVQVTSIPIRGWTTNLKYQVPSHMRKRLLDKFSPRAGC